MYAQCGGLTSGPALSSAAFSTIVRGAANDMTPEHALAMARYNSWMNDKVYAAAGTLDDAARKLDRGAFFGSIHGTLNHLLVGDRIWMARFTAVTSGVSRLDEELYGNFDDLAAERQRLDAVIVDWAAGLSADDLARQFEYTSLTGSVRRRSPMWFAVAHMFNHQTHHRGQLSTLLYQAGQDVGITDLSYLPGYGETLA